MKLIIRNRRSVFIRKVWMTMRITAIIILAVSLHASAYTTAQNITLSSDNITVKQFFKHLKNQTGYSFLLDKGIISPDRKISVNAYQLPLEKVLEQTLKPLSLSYRIEDKIVYIINSASNARLYENSKSDIRVSASPLSNVKGRIVSQGGGPLAGASVTVKGTNIGASSNAGGYYSINVPDDRHILVFTYVGYVTQEVALNGRSVIDITLVSSDASLGEVVVTALGVMKKKEGLSYATQEISNSELVKVKDINVVNSLAGKVAGAVITRGTMGPGSPTRVLIRGNKSFTGNSAPLYVIDGTPTGRGDLINHEDVESVQILPGASAAALYGSQAANGVILITTKKGKKGAPRISASSSLTFEEAVNLPELQTNYGQTDPNYNDSWGPKITNGSDRHLKEFFKTGVTRINTVSVTNGNEHAQIYMSYSNTSAKGILPENSFLRNNYFVKATTQMFDNKLSLEGSLNYINEKAYNQPSSAGYVDTRHGNSNAYVGLLSFPVGDDWSLYDGDNFEKWDPVRQMNVQNWKYMKDEGGVSVQSPYWVQNRNQTDNLLNYSNLVFKATYKAFSWLNVQGRAIYDDSYTHFEKRNYASSTPTWDGVNGGYGISNLKRGKLYTDLLLTSNKDISSSINLSAIAGVSSVKSSERGLDMSTTASSTLQFPNFFSIYSLSGLFNKSEFLNKRVEEALFANATIGFKNKLFLDLTGRNEWSSTTTKSFFYPSAGLTYILKRSNAGILSYAKLRASYAEVGTSLPFGIANNMPPYTLNSSGALNARGALPFFDGTDTVTLKPERTRSYEIGTDLKFLDNRLSLNLSLFDVTTHDQVFTITAPAGSGAANFWINGGSIRNRGFEGIVSYNAPIGNVRWTPSLTFSHYKNQIRELSDLLLADYFVVASFNSTRLASIFLRRPKDGVYGSYGDLFGKVYEKDEKGDYKLDGSGYPIVSTTADNYIGNANPSFIAGLNNTFTYKNFWLSFLIDSRFGGGVISRSEMWLDFKGLSKRSGEARDAGGILFNGGSTYLDPYTFYLSQTGAGFEAAVSEYYYDATNIRMRELSFGYSIPKFSRFFNSIDISLIARNLFFLYKNAPFDPEIGGTISQRGEGMDNFLLPATRSLGLNLRLEF